MSTLHKLGAAAADFACFALGRRQVVRTARFVLRRASLDAPNDMRANGEERLQRWIP